MFNTRQGIPLPIQEKKDVTGNDNTDKIEGSGSFVSAPPDQNVDRYKIISHFDFTRCSKPEEKSGDGALGSLTGEWLDSPAAARFLGISVGSLRNMTSNGQIPYSKLGRRNRYRTEDLRQLLTKEKRGCYGN